MSKPSQTNLKMNQYGKEFIDNMKRNRSFILKKDVTLPECLDVLAKYFKLNNHLYQEMIKLGDEQC